MNDIFFVNSNTKIVDSNFFVSVAASVSWRASSRTLFLSLVLRRQNKRHFFLCSSSDYLYKILFISRRQIKWRAHRVFLTNGGTEISKQKRAKCEIIKNVPQRDRGRLYKRHKHQGTWLGICWNTLTTFNQKKIKPPKWNTRRWTKYKM